MAFNSRQKSRKLYTKDKSHKHNDKLKNANRYSHYGLAQ